MLIKNNVLAESRLIIGKENPIVFDKQGIAEIAPELADKLLKLKGYELVDKNKKGQAGADEKENKPKETILGKGTIEVEEMKVGEPRKEFKVGEAIEMSDEEKIDLEGKEFLLNYESLSNKELKELIKEKGEKVPSGANKAELVEILKSLDK